MVKSFCPLDFDSIAESLILHGCHPLPRRCCFSRTPPKPTSTLPHNPFPSSLPDQNVLWSNKNYSCNSFNCLIRSNPNLGFDPSREIDKFTSYTNELDLLISQLFQIAKSANSALRLGLDIGVLDLVQCGHVVNRWIPVTALEFLLFDVDIMLRSGGYLWLDHFFSKSVDLDKVYGPLIRKLGYKKVKWATGSKADLEYGEVYLIVAETVAEIKFHSL